MIIKPDNIMSKIELNLMYVGKVLHILSAMEFMTYEFHSTSLCHPITLPVLRILKDIAKSVRHIINNNQYVLKFVIYIQLFSFIM